MRLTVFGSTGMVGRLVVALALEQGHDVTAFARAPRALSGLAGPRLRVVEGELSDREAVGRAVEGAEAIVSALGPGVRVRSGELTAGFRTLLGAMEEHGVRRLVALSTASVRDPVDRPDAVYALLVWAVRILFAGAYTEIRSVADVIRASDVEWTLVRVGLLDNRSSSRTRAGHYGRGEVRLRVSRAGLARFLLQTATSRAFVRDSPAVSD